MDIVFRRLVAGIVGVIIVTTGTSSAQVAPLAGLGYGVTAPYAFAAPNLTGRPTPGPWLEIPVAMSNGENTTATELLWLCNDADYLYVGVTNAQTAGFNGYLSVWLDGRNDNVFQGSATSPHMIVHGSQASTSGWSGYNTYWWDSGVTGGAAVAAPTGYESYSGGQGTNPAWYSFRFPLTDLGIANGSKGTALRLTLVNGTDGTAAGDLMPVGVSRPDAATWLQVSLAGPSQVISAFSAPTTVIAPKMNGLPASGAVCWEVIPVDLANASNGLNLTEQLFICHDNSYLYVGITGAFEPGWNSYVSVYADGMNNTALTGSQTAPHLSTHINVSSPGGWSGYDDVWVNGAGGGTELASEPPGYESASSGSGTGPTSYTFRIPLSDLGVGNPSLGARLRLMLVNGTDGSHDLTMPSVSESDPSTWLVVTLS